MLVKTKAHYNLMVAFLTDLYIFICSKTYFIMIHPSLTLSMRPGASCFFLGLKAGLPRFTSHGGNLHLLLSLYVSSVF